MPRPDTASRPSAKGRRGRAALFAALAAGCLLIAVLALLLRPPDTGAPAPEPVATPRAAANSAQAAAAPGPFTVGAWNVGLNDAEAAVIEQMLADFQGVDLWGLAEVTGSVAAPGLERAAESGEGADFASVLGLSGDGQQLLALYDATRFTLLRSEELHAINTTGNARAPLVLHLRERRSGLEFLFMVNHLYRSRDDERLLQAQLLAQWAAGQSLPVIAVGDYNFDWAAAGGERNHDAAYDALTADGAWQWVRPPQLVTTQCSGWPCAYASVLDFIFTAGPAQGWPAAGAIAVVPGDFPDDATRSDHRAVLAQFAPGGARLADEFAAAPSAMPAAAGAVTPSPIAGAEAAAASLCVPDPSPPPDPLCAIKGNIGSAAIYHQPGQRDYCRTVIDEDKGERWFCTVEEAAAAGWRAAKR